MKDNLFIDKYPDIAKEWDYEKNEGIDINTISYGSVVKVWWFCEKGHIRHEWKTTVLKRTKENRGCKICKKKSRVFKKSLGENYPELIEEWDADKNKIDFNEIYYRARVVVWWKCKNNHSYQLMIRSRVNGIGCKLCDEDAKLLKDLFPELVEEWDFTKNQEFDLNKIKYGSSKVVNWKCKKGHSWSAKISSRTHNHTGCPECSGKTVGLTNNLKITHPEIANEWNYDRNDLLPENVTYGSNIKVWWKCNKGHEWETAVCARTIKNTGCLYCNNILVTKEDSFGTKFPNLLNDWDYEKNIDLDPFKISEFSHIKIWWKCNKGHEWMAQIYNRSLGSECPVCTKGSFSKIGIAMLQYVENKDNIKIQHALNGGEYKIKLGDKTIKVDGYCKETNTVYEINGCFYHAHISPKCYLRRNWEILDIHPYGKTYVERYIDTLVREVELKKLGYNVVSFWECECMKILK